MTSGSHPRGREAGNQQGERIHKVLAKAGVGSRRQIERWIREGRIEVEGEPAQIGQRLGGDEAVRVDGRTVPLREASAGESRVLAYYKPEGEVSTRSDPGGRPTIFDRLPEPPHGRWVVAGRLDFNSTGLTLFCTDGELAGRLMHPRYGIEREYAVRVRGDPSAEVLARLLEGVELEDGRAAFDEIRPAGGTGRNRWYHVVLREGRQRVVRRLWASQGVTVSRLIRVRFGPVQLPPGLRTGESVELSRREREGLYRAVGLAGGRRARNGKRS